MKLTTAEWQNKIIKLVCLAAGEACDAIFCSPGFTIASIAVESQQDTERG